MYELVRMNLRDKLQEAFIRSNSIYCRQVQRQTVFLAVPVLQRCVKITLPNSQ